MTRPAGRPRPWSTIGGVAAAVGACAVCCAGPLVAVLGAVAAAGGLAAVWVPVLAVVAVAALVGAFVVRRRRPVGVAVAAGRPARGWEMWLAAGVPPVSRTVTVTTTATANAVTVSGIATARRRRRRAAGAAASALVSSLSGAVACTWRAAARSQSAVARSSSPWSVG
jgi:hypothetical protein